MVTQSSQETGRPFLILTDLLPSSGLLNNPLGMPSTSKRTWYAVSMAVAWRASLALEFEGSNGFEDANETIIAQYLRSLAAAELVAMVPLDYHPLGGYVMLGGARQISTLADMLPTELSSFSAESVEKLFTDGGGPAL